MMRILNILVIGVLVAAAAYVYKIKFESTRQAERLAKFRMEIRQEQDAIAALRAEWSKLDTPARLQELAKRHLLTLKAIDPRQIDTLRNLPERPPDLVPPDSTDPIGSLLENPEVIEVPTTSSISAVPRSKR
jgi:cell division protein FtsL